MNPDTGKHVSRLNKTSEWMSREVPELRIVPDDLWTAAKSRQKQTRHAMKTAGGRQVTRTVTLRSNREPARRSARTSAQAPSFEAGPEASSRSDH